MLSIRVHRDPVTLYNTLQRWMRHLGARAPTSAAQMNGRRSYRIDPAMHNLFSSDSRDVIAPTAKKFCADHEADDGELILASRAMGPHGQFSLPNSSNSSFRGDRLSWDCPIDSGVGGQMVLQTSKDVSLPGLPQEERPGPTHILRISAHAHEIPFRLSAHGRRYDIMYSSNT